MTTIQQKHFSRYKEALTEYPNFVENQLISFEDLLEKGVSQLFKEFTPIKDYSEKKFTLEFLSVNFGKPKYNEFHAKYHNLTYDIPLRARVKLINHTLGTEKEQEIFMADFPAMTNHGTFIINGVERVIVPQLIRSFGILFAEGESRGKRRFGAKIIPSRGAWIEIETDHANVAFVRIDKKRKFPITTLLRVMASLQGKELTDAKLKKLFKGDKGAEEMIKQTLEKDPVETSDDAFVEVYRRIREGDIVSPQNAREFIETLFSEERYDLSDVGRIRFNQRFDLPVNEKKLGHTLTLEDFVVILKHITKLNADPKAEPDDVDHLGSRRVRFVGEMLENKMRVGMTQMKRNIQDRMSTIDADAEMPIRFISPRPLQARIKEFFTTNQLSHFMQQENILDEIEHLRTLSALGPGGLRRERAGLEVRDVHPSHYGRVCPIQTPEGPNIGLVLRLATFARVNNFGIIETPYATVKNGKITGEIKYYDAFEEEGHKIAHALTEYDSKGRLLSDRIEVRYKGAPMMVPKEEVTLMDVGSTQAFSIGTSMIPFLNHNDANRALMGSNMQRQATPCIVPEAALVATGIEEEAARDTGRLVIAQEAGEIVAVDARRITIKDRKGKKHEYPLINFNRTNSATAFHQRPIISLGDSIKRGQVIADATSSVGGQMAIGQNIRVAFMTWHGANYEDAIIISERLIKKNKFTSINLEEFKCIVRDTKLGPEVTTHDIPNVGEPKLRNLDEDGIVHVGAEVRPGDILVGKITPKGESQLTPEERLLRSIFGEKARDVKDTSLRMETGKRGRVVGVKVFSRENGDQLQSGIIKEIYVEVAQLRTVSVGDKLAGRHGNKGVISTILPEEDMPYTADGTPIDIILTPLGVPSRMNLGQILEMHLGFAAHELNYQAVVPPFAGATAGEIRKELVEAGLPESGKVTLYDGRTGESFDQPIAVGYMYMLKLHHMVEDKIHMRSIGPYSLITQQPLGGRAQDGGQRFGEMEVWALLGYGAAYTLREMLTIKSDDILGRSAAFDAIVKGRPIQHTNVPAAFNVLLNNLRALSLDVQLVHDNEDSSD